MSFDIGTTKRTVVHSKQQNKNTIARLTYNETFWVGFEFDKGFADEKIFEEFASFMTLSQHFESMRKSKNQKQN